MKYLQSPANRVQGFLAAATPPPGTCSHVALGHAGGELAVVIGRVLAGPAGRVTVPTIPKARRMVPLPVGERLPRIG